MSDADHAHEAVERLDYDDQKADRPGFDRRTFLRRTALTGVAAGSVGSLAERLRLERDSSSGASSNLRHAPKATNSRSSTT